MFDAFDSAAAAIVAEARKQGRLLHNPTENRLRDLALRRPEVRLTSRGSLCAESEPMSRAKPFTANSVDTDFGKAEKALLAQAKKLLGAEPLICLDVLVRHEDEPATARLVVPRRFAHVAYGGMKLFGPRVSSVERPTYTIVMCFDEAFEANKQKALPDKDITIRVAFGDDGRMVKMVRNSNYVGEWKKGVFTGENWRAKLMREGLFLHAGCRKDRLESVRGELTDLTSLFVALSANGKTSLTCKVLARKACEESWLIQDDGGILKRDASFHGFELGGLYVKTDGLNPRDQVETYYGTLRPGTYLENVHVDPSGEPDFYNIERTSNGRAVIERRDFMHAGPEVNAPAVDNIFLITRGSTVPAIARLTPKQATAFMVLGQSMESSAGDPTQAGAIKNVFFYDPFLAGDRVEHAHLFFDILKFNPRINCYLLNTGGIGEGEHHHDITLADTLNILDSILRGGLTDWTQSPATGLSVPKAVRKVDSILFHPEKLYPSARFAEIQAALQAKRREILGSFERLDRTVREALG